MIEEEEYYNLRGAFQPHFFSIFINGEFNIKFENANTSDLGTFVHEYVHYLQNISTVFGLRSSSVFYNYLIDIKKHFTSNSKIKLPLEGVEHSTDTIESLRLLEAFNGTTQSFNPVYDEMYHSLETIKINNNEYKIVKLNFSYKNDKPKSITLGNLCVKEGMSRLCQLQFDSKANHNTFPYCAVELITKEINPQLLKDKRKLISLCLLSLNSQNCGYTLYELLINSIDDTSTNGLELYQKLSKKTTIFDGKKTKTLDEVLLTSTKNFKKLLQLNCNSKLDYINRIFENIELSISKNVPPLLTILYNDELDKFSKLYSAVGFYGLPHIYTNVGINIYPYNEVGEDLAFEFIELLGQQIVIKRITSKDNKVCPNITKCQSDTSGKFEINDSCYEKQWTREEKCPFTIVSNYWELDKKLR